MNDFKIDQSRSIGRRIVEDILTGSIAVRPAAAKIIAPEFVCPAKLSGRGAEHSFRQRSAIEVFPQAFARQFFGDASAFSRSRRLRAVYVDHRETLDFPASPLTDLPQ